MYVDQMTMMRAGRGEHRQNGCIKMVTIYSSESSLPQLIHLQQTPKPNRKPTDCYVRTSTPLHYRRPAALRGFFSSSGKNERRRFYYADNIALLEARRTPLDLLSPLCTQCIVVKCLVDLPPIPAVGHSHSRSLVARLIQIKDQLKRARTRRWESRPNPLVAPVSSSRHSLESSLSRYFVLK